MASSLSNLLNNFSEGIHRIKCKYGHDLKKCQTCVIKYQYCDCFLEYMNFKDNLIEYKCLLCSMNCQRKFKEKLKERFFNTYIFSNHTNNNFILFCKKVFILMNIWMIGKNSRKHHYLKNKIFKVTYIGKILLMQITRTQKD